MKKIAVDAMGGDNAPQALVEGVNQACLLYTSFPLYLKSEMPKNVNNKEAGDQPLLYRRKYKWKSENGWKT